MTFELGWEFISRFIDDLWLSAPHSVRHSDHIAIPDFSAGAMENWGLILYRETALLHDDKLSSSANKYWTSLVISHEIAHTVSREKKERNIEWRNKYLYIEYTIFIRYFRVYVYKSNAWMINDRINDFNDFTTKILIYIYYIILYYIYIYIYVLYIYFT